MKSRILLISSALLLIASGASAHEKGSPQPDRQSIEATDWSAGISDSDLDSAVNHWLHESPVYSKLYDIDEAKDPELKADEVILAKLRAWAKTVRPERVRRSYLSWADYFQRDISERRAELALNAHVK